jgi:hypothetical protein
MQAEHEHNTKKGIKEISIKDFGYFFKYHLPEFFEEIAIKSNGGIESGNNESFNIRIPKIEP